MAEFSFPWPDTTVGYETPVGDGRKITAEEYAYHLLQLFGAGVLPVGNMLAVTSPGANQIAVDTGEAIVYGRFYRNSTSKALAPESAPVGTTRRDSVILECDWAGDGQTAQYTVRAVILEGTAIAYPSLTQTPNALWQERLANYIIDDAGVISSLSDQRAFSAFRTQVNEHMLLASVAGDGLSGGDGAALEVNVDDSSIEIHANALRVRAGGITPAMIANRTRTFLVQPQTVYDQTLTAEMGHGNSLNGWMMLDGKVANAFATFQVPQDFASGMTVKALVNPANSGNVWSLLECQYAADGEAVNTHTASSGALAATALTASILQAINEISLAAAAPGDFVTLRFSRDSTGVNDTINGIVYIWGFLVSYTADS